VPAGVPAIFIPFFLTHDRLRQLERKIILEVEGESPAWFMKLIRHEAAHAYAYAYQFMRKRKWQRTFVVHLDDWYAQSHPDEDFAETFAVWLTPGLDWRARYQDWRALQKLEYVDELMRSLAAKPPLPMPDFPNHRYIDLAACLIPWASFSQAATCPAVRQRQKPESPRKIIFTCGHACRNRWTKSFKTAHACRAAPLFPGRRQATSNCSPQNT
jgi:hypothetical protein